ncbi:FadR family transcriptional regulator [Actinoalloteichus sp. AHMU CJ021]|uniref:Transcriptional regulator, GntR family n=1 Tax=Actinoalloteichus caeruleus DSM 43889 TaxID=1120930 RepID=A0ABT1JLR0_ACTCY|nr:FCD domain-containing protein [Actinoalloteichus caeruleus]AUS81729.1 FadR family transcriptional regulator [Actinoalloteichus sp. AHMU CJ021]MCP2333459.1 transcriptional regulator, GntR family [Actinoalloteichus caeruleus DSM 43889]
MAWVSLHDRLLEELGLAVTGGTLAAGDRVLLDELADRFDVSRSVIREVVRVLEALSLVSSRRRVGVVVLPASEWNLYDPRVIRWRLAGDQRADQLRSLSQLRAAVEPAAAALAAHNASIEVAAELMSVAGRLRGLGRSGDLEAFLVVDIAFHQMVLLGSGNEMFAQLSDVVAEVLTGRTQYGLMPRYPAAEALQLHIDVADAVQRGDAAGAQSAMLRIVDQAVEELAPIWR